MAKYRIETDNGVYIVETDEPESQNSVLDYRTGNNWIDAPLGLVQGAVKGLGQSTYTLANAIHSTPIGTIADKIEAATGLSPAPTPQQAQQMFTARGIGQGTGKFLENTAEFVLPSTAALKGVQVLNLGTKAALAARALSQAGVGAGVSALQSNGDPTSTVVGGVLGGLGELAGPAVTGVKNLVGNKAPTLANFAESFGKATPTQKRVISDALPTLVKDGVNPADSLAEMHDVVKTKLDDLGQQYNSLDPAIKGRQTSPADLIKSLRDKQQAEYMRKGVITDKQGYNAIEEEIDKVKDIAKNSGGSIDLDDIVHLKQKANGRTTFNSPDAEVDLYKSIGDSYREAANKLAPETTPLNQDYAQYSQLAKVTGKNLAEGKGNTASGLDKLVQKAASHTIAAGVGGKLGNDLAGPWGGVIGGVVGGVAGPKLTKATIQAFQNAVDNGAFSALKPAQQNAIKLAARAGNNDAVVRLLRQYIPQATFVSPNDQQQQ
jgi:hypothetical protein